MENNVKMILKFSIFCSVGFALGDGAQNDLTDDLSPMEKGNWIHNLPTLRTLNLICLYTSFD